MVEPERIASLGRDPLDATLLPPEPRPSPGAQLEAQLEAPPQAPPEVEPQGEPEPREVPSPAQPANAEADPLPSLPAEPNRPPQTLNQIFALVDEGWRQFRTAAGAFPSERMDERLSEDGWTRKQMLAHVAAWHDLTHDRLGKLIMTGQSADLAEKTDSINARVARQAIGRTGGEVLKEMEMTFNRLRRQLARLTDEQLATDDGWAAQVIAANTYGHYEEHRADVYMPPPPDGRRR